MIKKISSLSFSIICVGFFWKSSPAHAIPGCETFCQASICRTSPDLAAICFNNCPQAQACHMAAMDEFRRLHEIHNRPSRGQKPRKNRDNQVGKEKGSTALVSQPDTSTLPSDSPVVQTPSELPPVPDSPVVQTPSELPPVPDSPVVQTPSELPLVPDAPVIQPPSELPLVPPPPPPPSDDLLTKPLVKAEGETPRDLLAQLRAQRDLLKKPTQESDSESPNGEKEATSRENGMLQAIKKAMKTRRPHLDPDHHISQNNTPPSDDDDDWDN